MRHVSFMAFSAFGLMGLWISGLAFASACPGALPNTQIYTLEGDPRGAFECFGACGRSCEHQGCSDLQHVETRSTVTASDGSKACRVCTYRYRTCGSHEGCRWHDAAWMGCSLDNPPDGSSIRELQFAACKRTADVMMTPYYSVSDIAGWMEGGGPIDSYVNYSEVVDESYAPGECTP